MGVVGGEGKWEGGVLGTPRPGSGREAPRCLDRRANREGRVQVVIRSSGTSALVTEAPVQSAGRALSLLESGAV